MASRKNHHFIPQFYLKHFASTKERKEIGLNNISNGIYCATAPIRSQASKKFLYGRDDELEAALGKLEGVTAEVFKILLETMMPPPESSAALNVIKEFLLYQMYRTVKAGNEVNDMFNDGAKEFLKRTGRYQPEFDDYKIVYTESVLMALQLASRGTEMLDYLHCKPIFNISERPFITSDNPAIKYNQYLEKRNITTGTLGLAVKGLQIFFPIHSHVMLVFYDQFVYKMVTKSSKGILLNDVRDIDQLNLLQMANCDEQVFHNGKMPSVYFENLSSKVSAIRKRYKPLIIQANIKESKSAKLGRGFIQTTIDPQLGLSLSFIKVLKHAKRLDLGHNLVKLRHISLARQSHGKV